MSLGESPTGLDPDRSPEAMRLGSISREVGRSVNSIVNLPANLSLAAISGVTNSTRLAAKAVLGLPYKATMWSARKTDDIALGTIGKLRLQSDAGYYQAA